MVQVNLFRFKNLLINVVENLFNRIGQHFVDKISEGTVSWLLGIKINCGFIYYGSYILPQKEDP